MKSARIEHATDHLVVIYLVYEYSTTHYSLHSSHEVVFVLFQRARWRNYE